MTTTAKQLPEMSDAELAQEIKKRKNNRYLSCGYVGFMGGIALYATISGGFGLLTFLPVPFFPMLAVSNKKYKEATSEQQRRLGNVQSL